MEQLCRKTGRRKADPSSAAAAVADRRFRGPKKAEYEWQPILLMKMPGKACVGK
jgi:hypothetical protein